MSDKKDNRTNGTADNMSQNNEAMEDALANELNVDDSVSGMQHLDDEMSDESELKKMQKDLDEAKDKYVRLVAEFDNFRKRNAKERLELISTAGKDIVQSLLVVLDDMERAEKQLETTDDVKAIKEGVMLVFNKLRSTLQHRGLKAMESKNEAFNPDMHEAITEIPVPSDDMKGKVIDEVEKGYYLNDKLIRHAKVVVGK
ncbi:nucleotide exchange factor GrpE [Polluticoccus soli]|uniref:nucleotide exchange factor GrpE n=1 Tax=Polluticoccus soli TaxID=3034150 RepID=UPI0023E147E0|nr:nucleotide exchange factor GrpE [Flavipsychrobacter sp. JY13-12]